ncbi:MAG: hypothetical protein IJY89_06315, partial [Clostridia bacterium]|nr:hypothetical protein [Clostridia bacterium]
TYDVFVVYGGALYRVATGVPATPDGYTLELDKAYKADGVAFMPTSWNNGNWTTLSEVRTYSAAVDAEIADVDIDGKDLVIISKDGGADYGNANAPGNLIDGKENTCFGSNWPNIKSISVSFLGDKWFDSVKLTAMNEGADQLDEGEPFG